MPSVIALDAMGSDKAPKPEIEGALQAARHHGARVLLVGPESRLKAELAHYPGARHLFDNPDFAGGKRLFGMSLQYDRNAAAQSRSELRDFLAANLGR